MFISHLYFLISSFMSNFEGVGGFSLFQISKSTFTIAEISFGLSSLTDFFYTLFNFVFVTRMCMIVICPSITMFAFMVSEFHVIFGKIFILSP